MHKTQHFLFPLDSEAATGLTPSTLLKKRPWHRCFPVNFAKFLRTPLLQNTSGQLFLLTEIQNICSIIGNDFKQNHKKHEDNYKDIDFNEPVDELEALKDLRPKKKDTVKKEKYGKATKKDVKGKDQKGNGARKDNYENYEKRNEQDKEKRQKTWLKNEDYNYDTINEPDNNDDDYFEDEEESPLEYDQSDLEEDEEDGNYDDEEQDYWDVDSEKKADDEGVEQDNEKNGEGEEGILM